MGNVLLRGGIHRPRRIKILKADGTVMKLQSPVSVKQILFDYPNHGIFEAPASPRNRIGSLTQPLPEKAELAAGHLYYLIPLPFHSDELTVYNNNSKKGPFAKASSGRVPSAGCRLQPPSIAGAATDSIKQDPVVHKINSGGLRVVSSSCSTNGSSVRVKLRLRKEEVASFLAANNLIIQRPTRQSALSAWKPRLDTIDELHNPLLDS